MFECGTCGLEYYGDEMCGSCGDCVHCCECLEPIVLQEANFDRDELGEDPEEDSVWHS